MEYSLTPIVVSWLEGADVLILILMEYSLTVHTCRTKPAADSLNPYSNGILPDVI